jgi:tRNA G10  N-methylase Trm11
MQLETKPVIPRKGAINVLQKDDAPVHGWYRFVLSFPPHLVRQYLQSFGASAQSLILDPFCGTGTTLVEAKKRGVPSIGCDAHPFAAMVSRVKTNWDLNLDLLRKRFKLILRRVNAESNKHGLEALSFDALMLEETPINGYRLSEEEERLLPTGFLSQRPLQRLLVLRDEIESVTSDDAVPIREFFLVALAHVTANGAGNFAFGPEIYRTKPKPDYDVAGHFARQVDLMLSHLGEMQRLRRNCVRTAVYESDARTLDSIEDKVSGVITSPPYPNEKDYTRTTRVEAILLRIVSNREALREVKESMLRSNTRNVFVNDQDSDEVRNIDSIQKVCRQIEKRRVELEKDSGFERLYHKVVAHYFGGMRRHLRVLRPKLRTNAQLAYVVGDQLSFLMVPVATATLLAEVAELEGYRTVRIDLWRERVGTKVKNSETNAKTVRIREEILVLQKA